MSELPSMRSDRPAAGLIVVAVEDEALIALDLQDMLIAGGAKQILIARDAASLTNLLKTSRPDIAIVNAEPAHDGIAAARMLRDAGIPFFFATGASGAVPLNGFAVPVVPKPYSADLIFEALATILPPR